MIRFGVVGIGVMGTDHAKSLMEGKVGGAELAAVCDTHPARLEWFKSEYPGVATYDNTAELFASGKIDAVIVSTPHYGHPPIAMEAFAAGVHVMIEKPAGVYTKQVREMNEAFAKNDKNLVFGIMHNQRTHPMYRKMREIVHSGELGELRRTSWLITDWYRSQAYYDSGGWRATWKGEGGGVLINQCPHNLDMWQWICGMPKRITAFVREGKNRNIEVENDVTAYVEYENGASGIFVTSTVDSPGSNRFEIVGDKGKLVCEDGRLVHYKLTVSESEFNRTNTQMFGSPAYERFEVDCPGSYPQHIGVLYDFVKTINNEGELIAKGEEGINGLTISNAIHLSGWLNKTIELPLDEELFLAELDKRRN
jgi:predicted dehydrogenase